MSIHVAITRRVQPGREAEFQRALHDFLHGSLARTGVYGAHMLVPLPGARSREFGVLRTFADAAERDAFYASPLFRQWEDIARGMTEGEPTHRELHGLEAWFRGTNPPPPRWKMAVLTFGGVYPLTSVLPPVLGRLLAPWPLPLINVVVTALVVATLTWVIMPVFTRIARPWLVASALRA